MDKTKIIFNPVKGMKENYKEKYILEEVKVKDIDDLLVQHHYWEDPQGELWGSFDDPMENLRLNFEAYRKRKGFMSPLEIKKLREKNNYTVREFADILGLGSSTLSQIENNQRLQVKYQDNLFKWFESANKEDNLKLQDHSADITFQTKFEVNWLNSYRKQYSENYSSYKFKTGGIA